MPDMALIAGAGPASGGPFCNRVDMLRMRSDRGAQPHQATARGSGSRGRELRRRSSPRRGQFGERRDLRHVVSKNPLPREEDMKAIGTAMLASVLVLSGGAIMPNTAWAQSIQFGPGGVRVDDGRRERGGGRRYCAELRAACLNKERLGEQGEGNCRRYRRECRGR